MKTTMTERDKKLLTFMFLFVVVVAIGYWGIYPQVKKYNSLGTKIEKEEDEKKLNQMKIANLGLIEMQAEEYEGKISEKKDEFYQIMNSSEIDRMMTEMATSNKLDIYELNFTMPAAPTDRMAYQYSELYARQLEMKAEYESSEEAGLNTTAQTSSTGETEVEGEDSEDDKSGAEATVSTGDSTAAFMEGMMGGEEGGYQPNTDIYAVPVTMTVGGDLKDLKAFINSVINMDRRVLLVGYSWGEFRDVIRRDANGNIIRNIIGDSSSGSYTSTVSSPADTETSDSSSEGGSDTQSNIQVEVVTKKSLTVRLEIYMCDTASIEDSVNGATDAENGEVSEEGAEEGETSGDGTSINEIDNLLDE